MGKLKLVNNTGWDTRDLRRFVLAGLKAEKGIWYSYTVIIDNIRHDARYSGWGAYHQNWMRLLVQPADELGVVSHLTMDPNRLVSTARTLAHEVQHNRGERHKDMAPSCQLPVEWAYTLHESGFVIRRAPQPKPKPKRDIVNERHIHAAQMLAQHEAKMKREQKLVKKWRAKVRYYERAAVKKAANRAES